MPMSPVQDCQSVPRAAGLHRLVPRDVLLDWTWLIPNATDRDRPYPYFRAETVAEGSIARSVTYRTSALSFCNSGGASRNGSTSPRAYTLGVGINCGGLAHPHEESPIARTRTPHATPTGHPM